MKEKKPLLRIEQMVISYLTRKEWRPLVQDVSFSLSPGEILALVGPSGCGKSLTAQAIVGLLEPGFRVTRGHFYYQDTNISQYNEKEWQRLRREEIALLVQDSLSSLNPIRTVKSQMVETINLRKKGTKGDVESYLCSLLSQVGFTHPEEILISYPFELSGGMRQRVLLAMMLSLQPKILIADEPTTALDIINRERVWSLFKKLRQDFNLAILLISHDKASVQRIADRAIEMSPGGRCHELTGVT